LGPSQNHFFRCASFSHMGYKSAPQVMKNKSTVYISAIKDASIIACVFQRCSYPFEWVSPISGTKWPLVQVIHRPNLWFRLHCDTLGVSAILEGQTFYEYSTYLVRGSKGNETSVSGTFNSENSNCPNRHYPCRPLH